MCVVRIQNQPYASFWEVFKVETIGDCYVAVAGLPDAMKGHAVAMAKFAHECTRKMKQVTAELESTLGPGTSDLDIRVGLHSGPVTAGVLRGDKSRFQLFGDTMNTASRMESTGEAGKIQVSETTASLLEASGKRHWLCSREDPVPVKGKGEMKTYWLLLQDRNHKNLPFPIRELVATPNELTLDIEAATSKDKLWGELSWMSTSIRLSVMRKSSGL